MRAARISLLRYRFPFFPRGKRCAAASEQLGLNNFLNHALGTKFKRLSQSIIPAQTPIAVKTCSVYLAHSPQQPQLRLLRLRRGDSRIQRVDRTREFSVRRFRNR